MQVYHEISGNSLEDIRFGQVFFLTSNDCSLGKIKSKLINYIDYLIIILKKRKWATSLNVNGKFNLELNGQRIDEPLKYMLALHFPI